MGERTPEMAMSANEIEGYVRRAFPDAGVKYDDRAGDGDHYACTVTSEALRGLPRVRQHQLVYDALQGHMGGTLHALALRTATP